MFHQLTDSGKVSEDYRVSPRPGFECAASGERRRGVKMPKLFGTYLRYGGVVCGPPAIDREFRTIDFLVMIDAGALQPRLRSMFFSDLPLEDYER